MSDRIAEDRVRVWRDRCAALVAENVRLRALHQHEFMNGLRILISIDHHEVPFLDGPAWHKFQTDPFRFLMRAGDEVEDRIWAVIQSRQPVKAHEPAR